FRDNDSRFKYFEHSNIGQGKTRNRGINIATGEYLAFVDSDDYIDPQMIANLYDKIIRTNTDVVCGEMIRKYPNGKTKINKNYKNLDDKVVTNLKSELFYKQFFFTGLYSPNPVD